MLNPNNNRLDYGSILSAPPNYELDFAIGTSYSLDLDSLVGASISLGLSQETDTILRNNPIFLLEALRSTGDKVALFCEKGRISMPRNPTQLYILLEEMVFQVNPSKREKIKGYPAFHPKFWLVRYVSENDDVAYRVIVLSRNLTFDRSWDISFCMDGVKLENSSNQMMIKNRNLSIFLNYLKDFSTDSNKTEKINEIIRELDYVEFDLNSNTFYDFDFIPNGVRDNVSIENYPLFEEDFDDLAIMTPFLSKTVIGDFNKRIKGNESYQNYLRETGDTRCYLFTRAESLSKLNKNDCDEFKIYTLKDEIIDGEFTISGESDDSNENDYDENINGKPKLDDFNNDKSDLNNSNLDDSNDDKSDLDGSNLDGFNNDESDLDGSNLDESNQLPYQHQDIHAKIYFVRKGEQVDLYLGSLNASHNALNGNVEFMIRLKANYKKFKLENLLKDFFCGEEGGPESPFNLVDNLDKYHEDLEDESTNDLDSILKEITHLKLRSKVTFDDEFYKITLNLENFESFERNHITDDLKIYIKPLLSEKFEKFSRDMSFVKLNKIQLSTFFVVIIKRGKDILRKVIKVETDGMPDDRDKDVISSIVTGKTAFMRYVAFLLSEDSFSIVDSSEGVGNGAVTPTTRLQLPALYEKMLKAAVSSPDKFKEIDFLIQTLSDDNVIPEGFEELYNTFKGVLDNEQS